MPEDHFFVLNVKKLTGLIAEKNINKYTVSLMQIMHKKFRL